MNNNEDFRMNNNEELKMKEKNNTALYWAISIIIQEIDKVFAKDNLSSKKMTSRINMLHDGYALLGDMFARIAPIGCDDLCSDEDVAEMERTDAAIEELEALDARREELIFILTK